jgi:thiosulfate dehydrogenase [quinone] large subunit
MSTHRHAAAGFLALRLFLGQFWILQMIGKARDQESGITSLHNLSIWARNVTAWMVKTTPMPEWAVQPYTTVLPFVEVALGLLILLGLQTRRALIASAFVLVSLDVGLMFQMKHDVVASNTIFLLATVLALFWEPLNRWSLDALFRLRRVDDHDGARLPQRAQ